MFSFGWKVNFDWIEKKQISKYNLLTIFTAIILFILGTAKPESPPGVNAFRIEACGNAQLYCEFQCNCVVAFLSFILSELRPQ